METPASNRLGLAEPVSRTEGNKPSPSTVLGDARQEYTAAARHGRAGREVQARYSGRIDALIQQLAENARVHSGAALSVCALGGYGRRSLCLHSDIDLVDPVRARDVVRATNASSARCSSRSGTSA